MIEKRAKELFHGPESYNCAQAVLKTFEDVFPSGEACLLEFKEKGGGRAEGGLCGALYAAEHIVQDVKSARRIRDDFVKKIGAAECREIKRVHGTPCQDCVATAARLVANALKA